MVGKAPCQIRTPLAQVDTNPLDSCIGKPVVQFCGHKEGSVCLSARTFCLPCYCFSVIFLVVVAF